LQRHASHADAASFDAAPDTAHVIADYDYAAVDGRAAAAMRLLRQADARALSAASFRRSHADTVAAKATARRTPSRVRLAAYGAVAEEPIAAASLRCRCCRRHTPMPPYYRQCLVSSV